MDIPAQSCGRHRWNRSLRDSNPDVEVTKMSDKATAVVMKDTINMTRFSTGEIHFIADDPGPALLHYHHQDHQDQGFMGLVTYL
jgi:FtsP/CotA-like multicopper oxidase with cupredoxin domain